jgi:hypothetical protein
MRRLFDARGPGWGETKGPGLGRLRLTKLSIRSKLSDKRDAARSSRITNFAGIFEGFSRKMAVEREMPVAYRQQLSSRFMRAVVYRLSLVFRLKNSLLKKSGQPPANSVI